MADPVVRVDGELAERAAAKAAAEGVQLEVLIERMLREYVAGERSGRGSSGASS